MAMPQCAIAHPGSALAICSNCGLASSYQKSCSSATPRLIAACSEGAQEVAKDTVPSRSVGAGFTEELCAIAPKAKTPISNTKGVFMAERLIVRILSAASGFQGGARL